MKVQMYTRREASEKDEKVYSTYTYNHVPTLSKSISLYYESKKRKLDVWK
jgi:hypothetical protein